MKNYKVDIVVPIYGNANLVKKCVDSVLATTNDNARIILVDDCSPGNEIPNLFDNYKRNPRIWLHRSMLNQGFIGTTKIGARIGQSPYILFLNSDTIAMEENWVDKLIPKEKNVAIVGTKLLFPPTHPRVLANKVQHAGVAVTENARNQSGEKMHNIFHIFSGYNNDYAEVNRIKSLNTVTGACFLVRKDVWNRLGGWDINFGKGVYEDVDFCWRVAERGYDIIYNPSTFLYHSESAGLIDKMQHPLQKHGGENYQYLMKKWNDRIPLNGDSFYGEGTAKRWKLFALRTLDAIDYLNIKDWNKAEKIGRECIVTAPEFPGGYYITATSLIKSGNHLESINFLRDAIKANPVFWQGRFQLIEEMILTKQLEDATIELDLVKEIFPNNNKVSILQMDLNNAKGGE